MNGNIFNGLIQQSIGGTGDSDAHALTIFGIALSLKCKNILELGVREGATTLPLLAAANILGAKLTSVDINSTNFEPDAEMLGCWDFRQEDSLTFLKTAVENHEFFDLIYIDDWHSYKHVKQELVLIDFLIKPTSIVLLHDLMYGGTCPIYHCDLTKCSPQWEEGGPYRAVAELDPNFYEFSTIPRANGLTILRKKYSSRDGNW